MAQITVTLDVGEKVTRIVHCGANTKHGTGKSEKHILCVQEIHIIAGSPINRNKKTILYNCFNETTGKFEELSEDDMNELCNGELTNAKI